MLHREREVNENDDVDADLSVNRIMSGGVVTMCILPVVLMCGEGKKRREIVVYALLDRVSSGTFIDTEVANKLLLCGENTRISVTTLIASEKGDCKRIKGLKVKRFFPGKSNYPVIDLPTYTYTSPQLPIHRNEIPSKSNLKKWPYLKRIMHEVPERDPSIPIGLLIGGDCKKALEPLEVIPSQGNGPFATRSVLGWCFTGSVEYDSECEMNINCNRIAIRDVCTQELGTHHLVHKEKVKEVMIADYLKQMYMSDFNEVAGNSEEKGLSQEDKKFLRIMREGITMIDGHYQLPLPLRDPGVKMPNNRTKVAHMIERSLKPSLKRNSKKHADYTKFMNGLIEKGYVERVTPEHTKNDREGQVWFIPHHGVYHPKKPDKIRVVYNCAAKFDGVSLNAVLLQGPDLTNDMTGVLLRFRKEPIAFMADIEQMFYQVKVPPEQRSLLRFFWWEDGNLDNSLTVFQMCVHLFGGTSSPSVCHFAMKETAKNFKRKYGEEASSTLKRDFYVDDCLKSVETPEKAVQLICKLCNMCHDGGFKLCKFVSNSQEVLNSLSEEMKAPNMNIVNMSNVGNEYVVERALGYQWTIQNDSFGFRINLLDKPCTRKGVLATISSIHDPLGTVCPFLRPVRHLLQKITKEKASWDDPVDDSFRHEWERWRCLLPLLEVIEIDRCYKPPGFGKVVNAQLHNFADASVGGYGQVSYLRLVNSAGDIHVSFVMGKSRVSPAKLHTIPQLELTAVAVSSTVSSMLMKELDIENLTSISWTDSQIVLGYLNNETTRFRVFVANRIQKVRDNTDYRSWRYIETKLNPADHASRGILLTSVERAKDWLIAPAFLWKPERAWPTYNINFKVDENDPAILKSVTVNTTSINQDDSLIGRLSERISCWFRLKRVLVTMIKFLIIFNKGHQSWVSSPILQISQEKLISSSDLIYAEQYIIKQLQLQYFPNELKTLNIQNRNRNTLKTVKKELKGGSPLLRLNPFLDDDGIIRVGGRLKDSPLSYNVKYPIVLPKLAAISDLIIRWYHQQVQHGGRNMTLSKIRAEGYWIIGANSKTRQCIFNCVPCKRLRGVPSEQKMADLPVERLIMAPPFSYVGVDMFGHFLVKQGRSEVKRYGCIFTCLNSRAVHIEVTHSLETDSMINALRRFVARRGNVQSIRSDNGTNFVGASNELQSAWDEMDHERIHDILLREGVNWIQWKRNTPAASHMGGVWERQIRTVRSILQSLLLQNGHLLNDEILTTFMCEIEAIINSRPLTVESLSDPTSLIPLSPVQLLTLKPDVVLPPPGDFVAADLYCRRRWRRVQYLADEFWRRWRDEYLHSLQPRQKWTTQKRNLQTDDVVLLKDDDLWASRRNRWHLGRVAEVFPDKKGTVRQVNVKVCNDDEEVITLKRPIAKLVLLLEATNKSSD